MTSTPIQSDCDSGAANTDIFADVDLLDVFSGCVESQDDVDQLSAGLLEMEDEMKAWTDETSFLYFPCKIDT